MKRLHARLLHEDFSRQDEAKGGSDRAFGYVFSVIFIVIGFVDIWDGHPRYYAWLAAGSTILAVTFFAPKLLSPFNRLWMRLGLLLFHVINPIVMAILFYAVITPIGLMMRITGRRPLNLKLDPDRKSYWIIRTPPGPDAETMRHQF